MLKTKADFDTRNKKKQKVEKLDDSLHSLREGQFWRYYEGVNVWNEQSKWRQGNFRRVGLILSKKVGRGMVLILPLTTKYKEQQKFYKLLIKNPKQYGLSDPSAFLVNRFKVISTKRLIKEKSPYVLHFNFLKLLKIKIKKFI